MKNLVLEARSLSARGPSSLLLEGPQRGREGGPLSQDRLSLERELEALKESLLQRDHEIAILVNMVKKGVGVEAVSGKVTRGPIASASDGLYEASLKQQEKEKGAMQPHSSSARSDAKKDMNALDGSVGGPSILARGAGGLKALEQQQRERESAREELIIKRHLFGVPPPPNRAVFDDAAESYEWFRERCGLSGAMEDNRALLKDKINEAKVLGERANQSRNTITYLKSSIEAIRKERILRGLKNEEPKPNGEGDGDEGDGQESAEELTHRRAIEQEKSVYKETFERLRNLKPEIEQIKKLLESSREKIQSQFNEWFDQLHSRRLYDDPSPSTTIATAYSSQPPSLPLAPSRTSPRPVTGGDSAVGRGITTLDIAPTSSGGGSGGGGVTPSNRATSSMITQTSTPRSVPSKSPSSTATSSETMSGSASSYSSPRAMASSRLNEFKAASKDESVNSDIMAFYQAKEELEALKRKAPPR